MGTEHRVTNRKILKLFGFALLGITALLIFAGNQEGMVDPAGSPDDVDAMKIARRILDGGNEDWINASRDEKGYVTGYVVRKLYPNLADDEAIARAVKIFGCLDALYSESEYAVPVDQSAVICAETIYPDG